MVSGQSHKSKIWILHTKVNSVYVACWAPFIIYPHLKTLPVYKLNLINNSLYCLYGALIYGFAPPQVHRQLALEMPHKHTTMMTIKMRRLKVKLQISLN